MALIFFQSSTKQNYCGMKLRNKNSYLTANANFVIFNICSMKELQNVYKTKPGLPGSHPTF